MADLDNTTFAQLAELGSIPISHIADHKTRCCLAARHALMSRLLVGGSIEAMLSLVPQLIEWGPVRWPAAWCDLIDGDDFRGDCGVHADIAAQLMETTGLSPVRGRVALLPSVVSLDHWRRAWIQDGCDSTWVGQSLAHHEVVGLQSRWWDPSEARWFTGVGDSLAAGHVFAVREEGEDWELGPPR